MSSEGRNLLFIVGAPRSGTSWLQRLLGAHPQVVTTQETGLVSSYCAPLFNAWNEQLPAGAGQRGRHTGLPAVLTTEEFREAVLSFAYTVYDKALSLKPTATLVLDKNPEHSLHVPLVRALFPEAAFLHIVRDGRDVTDSILAAGRGWGRAWAPTSMRYAARTWRMHVEGARSAVTADRYLEIRYEDLVSDTSAVLDRCLQFAGMRTTAEERAAFIAGGDATPGRVSVPKDSIVWSGEVAKRLGSAPPEPEGFFRSGVVGSWRKSWTVDDALTFDAVAGTLLRELGYPPDSRLASIEKWQRLRGRVKASAPARLGQLGWWLHMLLGRRGLYVQAMRIRPYPAGQKAPQ